MDSSNQQEFLTKLNVVYNKKKEQFNAADVIKGSDVLAFYFSAHWCPPCRRFTPMLATLHETVVSNGGKLTIIFVSSDQSEGDMFSYMNESHGDWYCLPHNGEAANELKKKYGISGIPSLVVADFNGEALKKDARNDVVNTPDSAFDIWKKLYNK